MGCRYSNLFGKPGEGAHRYRVGGFAAVDLGLTLVVSWIIARWIHKSFLTTFLCVMLLGFLAHKLFCVQTQLTKLIRIGNAPSKQ
jgi:hypothetical protein